MGLKVGCFVGIQDGSAVGSSVGCEVGILEG